MRGSEERTGPVRRTPDSDEHRTRWLDRTPTDHVARFGWPDRIRRTRAGDAYIDLANTYLLVRAKVVRGVGTDIADDTPVAPVNN